MYSILESSVINSNDFDDDYDNMTAWAVLGFLMNFYQMSIGMILMTIMTWLAWAVLG